MKQHNNGNFFSLSNYRQFPSNAKKIKKEGKKRMQIHSYVISLHSAGRLVKAIRWKIRVC